ncbi:phosphatidate cytidylyltransferase [Sandaracinobacteroides sp. A072]|uniref:phosphatidate cytidylyltransferase n=1 Tax=Sandaracinobacteroides sp. A072 TaxID=3461146 RepID=UPI004041496C
MAGSDPATPPPAARSGLVSRIVIGLFLAVLAMADIWVGGPAFTALVLLGVCLIFWEWAVMHHTPGHWRIPGLGAIGATAVLAHVGRPVEALLVLGTSILVFAILSAMVRMPGKRWLSTGLAYAGLPAVALIWMRGQTDGFALVMWTMALVWVTDSLAYFSGRSIGGPKIWPAISPNKTWAGLIGGALGAALFSGLYAGTYLWEGRHLLLALVGAALAVVAQAGDFFESWLKRRAGVKDSGRLLGSHGGIMDRVDGLVPVSCVVALWAALAGVAV